MLNHVKVLKKLNEIAGALFLEHSHERDFVKEIWKIISCDEFFSEKLKKLDFPFMLPSWVGSLNNQTELLKGLKEYEVFAIDGSQIYPDRHQGIPCYLINIGSALFRYCERSSVEFNSEPLLLFGKEEGNEEDSFFAVSNEIVNCERTELELRSALEICKKVSEDSIFLFDGSLIFWHLDSKAPRVKRRFLKSYLKTLDEFYKNKLLHAGYISLPKSRELVNLASASLMIPDCINSAVIKKFKNKKLDYVVDSDIVKSFLKIGHRTILFENHSKIVKEYPEHLCPYFFYFNNGTEIVRIEIPTWIARDEKLIEKVTRVICDQCEKGYGYPVCLAESHEQAVVRNRDKNFFFHVIQKIALENHEPYVISQKSSQKKAIGV